MAVRVWVNIRTLGLNKSIHTTYPANFIKAADIMVQQIQQFKLQSSLFQVNMQSRTEYSRITNQTLHNFSVNSSNVSVMNVGCPLGI